MERSERKIRLGRATPGEEHREAARARKLHRLIYQCRLTGAGPPDQTRHDGTVANRIETMPKSADLELSPNKGPTGLDSHTAQHRAARMALSTSAP